MVLAVNVDNSAKYGKSGWVIVVPTCFCLSIGLVSCVLLPLFPGSLLLASFSIFLIFLLAGSFAYHMFL